MEQCTWQTCAFSNTESEWTVNCPDLKDPECSGYMTEGGVTIAECAAPSTCTATCRQCFNVDCYGCDKIWENCEATFNGTGITECPKRPLFGENCGKFSRRG